MDPDPHGILPTGAESGSRFRSACETLVMMKHYEKEKSWYKVKKTAVQHNITSI